MLMGPVTVDCCIPLIQTVHWLGIVMLTGQGTLRIGKELQVDISFLGITYSPDLVRNRIVCPYLLLKPSI